MALSFSSQDLRQLALALETLLSPLDHAHVDDWRAAVNGRLKDLLRADSAGFLLPVPDRAPVFSEEHDPEALARYPELAPPPAVDGSPALAHVARVGVVTLASCYGDGGRPYLDSEYYRDYAAPNHAHDTLAAAVLVGDGSPGQLAALHFWHERTTGRRFEPREVAMLRTLVPGLRAGVEAWLRWGGQCQGLLDALDALGHAVLVRDRDGREVHATRRLLRLLEEDPEGPVLRQAMKTAADAALLAPRLAAGRESLPDTTSVPVRTALGRYTARATLHREAGRSSPLALVALERHTPMLRPDAEIQQMFALTRAELGVAKLIARGLSNRAIADELCISPHTARRHTERVLLKLEARSRAEVGPKLLG